MPILKQQPAASVANPKSVGLLQRKCASCAKKDEEEKKRLGIQTKLRVSQPGDPLEKEANQVADEVLRKPVTATADAGNISTAIPGIQRESASPDSGVATATSSAVLNGAGSPRPLPTGVRSEFEARFGHDFSSVRIHTDSAAAHSAKSFDARAYTLGSHVVFGEGQFSPVTTAGQSLLAHELTHVIQQGNSDQVYRKEVENVAASDAQAVRPPASDSETGEIKDSWSVNVQLAVVKNGGSQSENGGANLREQPVPNAKLVTWLPQNTKVLITRENNQRWLHVSVETGESAGATGYIANWLVLRNPPDEESKAYTVNPGDKLGALVQNHSQYSNYDIRTGDDARALVMAVHAANRGRKGVRLNSDKLEKAQSGSGLLDFLDKYRSTLRPVYQSVELVAGETIWLPGTRYIEGLKSTGAIPKRSELKNVAIAGTKGAAGFVSGVAEGFGQSLADVVTGALDLVSTLKDILTGAAFDAAKEFINSIKEMSADELKEFGNQALDAVKTMITDGIGDFLRKWNAASPFDRWNFRGRVVGYILAEVAMMLVSGAIANAIKWAGKFTKIGGKVAAMLRKLTEKLRRVLPKRKKKGKRDRGDSDKEGTKREKERLLALVEARTLAEANDVKDTPIPGVMSQLRALKLRHPVIKKFRETEYKKGHHRIELRASPWDWVDLDYTPDEMFGQTDDGAEIDKFHRGLAIEDALMDRLKGKGYSQLPGRFKGIDAIKGSFTEVVESGKTIRVYRRADGISIKSTVITDPRSLRSKISRELNALRGRFSYPLENVRVEGLKTRQLHLVFDEGTASRLTSESLAVLAEMKNEAKAIRFKWFISSGGRIIDSSTFLKNRTLPDLD